MRILIADDHAIVRKGIKQLLLDEYTHATIEESNDAEELVKKVINGKWDVVICDLNLPGRSGLDALKQLKQLYPKLPVLIMSIYPEEQYAPRVLKAGASGYLGKDTIHDELIKAIETVRKGKKYINPVTAEKLVDHLSHDKNQPAYELLSDREFDVFKLLASGKSVSEIAKQLFLSATTISTYRSRILEKLQLQNNTELVRYAIENDLL
jgi:DNA-binding NarL/FixJ family response regulator